MIGEDQRRRGAGSPVAILRYVAEISAALEAGEKVGECSFCRRASSRLSSVPCNATVLSGEKGTSYRVATSRPGMFFNCAACGERARRFGALCNGRDPYRTDVPLLRHGNTHISDNATALKYVKGLPKPRRSRRPKRKPAAKPPEPKPAPVAIAAPSGELLRMYRRELLELGTPEALAEIDRRKAKRAARRAARTF